MPKLTPAQFNATAFEIFREANLASLNFHHEDFLCNEGFPNADLKERNKQAKAVKTKVLQLKNLCEVFLTH